MWNCISKSQILNVLFYHFTKKLGIRVGQMRLLGLDESHKRFSQSVGASLETQKAEQQSL